MSKINARLRKVLERIHQAEAEYGRKPDSVRLLAVSKTKPGSMIADAISAGQFEFGENYLQEALDKIKQIKQPEITWHFIGHLQSNKAKAVAENFAWLHTVDNIKLARRLSRLRPKSTADLNICIQVNISAEAAKSGCRADEVYQLAHDIVELPRLKLRGLMAIPKPHREFAAQRLEFAKLKNLFTDLNLHGFDLDTLSIGMSNDLEAAIAEGATMVRVGTDIFGKRT